MLGWWYSRGWLWVIEKTLGRLQAIGQVFAVRILLRTWFAPWKQIYTPTTFRNFIRNSVDNAVSRLVGGVVRSIILFCALVLSLLVITIGVISLVAWPFIPLLTLILPILALDGVTL